VIVVDASVLTNALTDDGALGDAGRLELARDTHWAAPEHLVVETFSAIRGRYLGRHITARRAREAIDALGAATIDLVVTTPLLPRMWALRDNVSGYDAAYVATAEAAECPFVTADGRLAQIKGVRCEVRVAVPSD
jgi:predicted nucleic acid-binding protein